MKKKLFVLVLLPCMAFMTPLMAYAGSALDAPAPDGVRAGGTLTQSSIAPHIPAVLTPLKRPVRNYPEQPPTIPHNVERYQVDKNFNQCLTCHSRGRSSATGAPMVSITHYLDRDYQPLAAVSPRRYFCLQCHVPQHRVEPLIGNSFKAIDEVINASQAKEAQVTE
jgi:cytochrome c-type protein NapB